MTTKSPAASPSGIGSLTVISVLVFVATVVCQPLAFPDTAASALPVNWPFVKLALAIDSVEPAILATVSSPVNSVRQ